jgi:BirA family biotin operon repressor/biotin-[acetyl-CoA-carboxylase] ligase
MPEKILSLLKTGAAFVSGQKISADLGITRAAVWKKILSLRKKGFVIEAVPSRGYRLISPPDLSVEVILPRVQGGIWNDLRMYDSVESTNDLAMSLASKDGVSSGTVLVADRQTRGKGRLNRKWESPAGRNVYLSMVLRPELAPRDATILTVLAAVAGARAVRRVGNIPVTIKWPNDLVLSDRKLGGILSEMRTDPDRITVAVIGVGINVNMESADFPEELRGTATSVLMAAGRSIPRNEIIIQLLREMELWYGILITRGKEPLLDAWRKESSTLGRMVRVAIGSQTVSGIARDIDENGMLVLETRAGKKMNISSGDISLLRPLR